MRKTRILAPLFILSLCLVLICGPVLAAGGADEPDAEAALREALAEELPLHISLDESDPIYFYGQHVLYRTRLITLGPRSIFVDGSMPQELADQYDYVYTSFVDAAEDLVDGTEEEPMRVYLAPYVYWCDDPDDPAISQSPNYGMVINCRWLRFEGLTEDAYNVVLCGNRGNTHGASGNWTLFRIVGDGLYAENVTFGNYCSIDLDYPLKPELSREKRTSTITQAQLFSYSGDKAVGINCNFVSRLNLLPYTGTRTYYYGCHFESTDDAISGSAVYESCDFDFYGRLPAYSLSGAIFLDCDFNSKIPSDVDPNQYISKAGGPGAIIDSRFHHEDDSVSIGWTTTPPDSLRCYQYNVTFNGEDIQMAENFPGLSVRLEEYPELLRAYKLDESTYNTYNLLRGGDNWDPGNTRAASEAAGADNLPQRMTLSPASATIESGQSVTLSRSVTASTTQGQANAGAMTWSVVNPEYADLITFTPVGDSVTVTGVNENEEPVDVVIEGVSAIGLHAASVVTVKPTELDPPDFLSDPVITAPDGGKVTVVYELDLEGREDLSLITWYRCADAQGTDPVPVAVSRLDIPEFSYELTPGDAGMYLMAEVAPRHIRSQAGASKTAIYPIAIAEEEILAYDIETDFRNFPTTPQLLIQPGYWTFDGYKPLDTAGSSFTPSHNAWVYDQGVNGASTNYGLINNTRGARLMYTPVGEDFTDMTVTLQVDPAKIEGQGFAVANQYMDVCLRFDTETLTGYALRIERTPNQSNGVEMWLVEYRDGMTYALTDPVRTSVFLSTCTIELTAQGETLTASVRTTAPQADTQAAAGLVHEVDLEAEVEVNGFGGFAVQHTGSTGGENSLQLHHLNIHWERDEKEEPGVDAEDIRIEGLALVSLRRGETVQLSAVVSPADAIQTVTWTSTAPDRAAVDETGLVTGGPQTGVAIITATTHNGLSYSIRVNVRN